MKITKISQNQNLPATKHRIVLILVAVTLGLFTYFFINSNYVVEAKCPTKPKDCPAGPQGPVVIHPGGGGDGSIGDGNPLTAPGINRCNKNDIDDTQKCRQDYRKCDRKDTQIKKVKCKIKAINDHKTGGGGGGAGGTDDPYAGKYLCGNIRTEDNGTSGPLSDDNYFTKFNFGCVGEDGPPGLNPIEDLVFALLRFLSAGVGIAVVIAVIGSGIQYISSEGNAEVTAKAKKRIRSAIIGLIIYIFAFSLFQFLVPGGIFWTASWLDVELISRLLL